MSFFYYDGLPIHYKEYGMGEPVLLVHGLGCSGADWELQVAWLKHRGFRLVVPDLPGCGVSAPPCGKYSICALAGALWAMVNELALPQVNIVGFSMGGAIALQMAIERPAFVPRLALINTLAKYNDHWLKWLIARQTALYVNVFGMRRAARLFAAGLFPEPWQQPLRDRASAAVGSVPASTYLRMARALEEWDVMGYLDRIQSRTLIIAAQHDFTPIMEKQVLAAKLKAKMIEVTGSRHGTPFDASDATNRGLLDLLTDQPMAPYQRAVRDTPDAPGSARWAAGRRGDGIKDNGRACRERIEGGSTAHSPALVANQARRE